MKECATRIYRMVERLKECTARIYRMVERVYCKNTYSTYHMDKVFATTKNITCNLDSACE